MLRLIRTMPTRKKPRRDRSIKRGPYAVALGRNLRRERERVNKDQASLAKDAGLSRNSVSAMERGTVDASLKNVDQYLQDGCGVNLAEFFGSRIPEIYADAEHRTAHELLQRILEDGSKDREVKGIRENLEAFIDAIEARAARGESKKDPGGPSKVKRSA